MTDRYLEADNVSTGWLAATRLLASSGNPWKHVHLILRIADPTAETPEIRTAAQDLIDTVNQRLPERKHLPHIDTTRNTIFPVAFTGRTDGPEDLAAYYRDRYRDIQRYRGNRLGTYFGRIVAYPTPGGKSIDQLSNTVEKLRSSITKNQNRTSRYEIAIYAPGRDRNMWMSFPCLAHVSLHYHAGRLHMQAIYRNESLVPRAYGNYLGLGQLLAYIADHSGAEVGELLMTLGHVEMGVNITPVREMLRGLADPPEAA